MAKYEIHIRESIDHLETVEAASKEAALAAVRKRFDSGSLVLSKENDTYMFEMYGYPPNATTT